MAAKYDKGEPQSARILPNGLVEVVSFRDTVISYVVDVERSTCTCPHHAYRVAPKRRLGEAVDPCKHVQFAREFMAAAAFVTRFAAVEPGAAQPIFLSNAAYAGIVDPEDFDPFAEVPASHAA